MAEKIQCDTHGESHPTAVCAHLVGQVAGLGFNRNEPTSEEPCPDAWCDDCEIIRAAHGGWNEEADALVKFSAICSNCYNRARIRNTRTASTLIDLSEFKWKCHTCEEWHTGLCDFGYDEPIYWTEEYAKASRRTKLLPNWGRGYPKTFLNEDYCVTNDEYFYARGLIQLPIIGTLENFAWGVWGSLSRENFRKLMDLEDDPKRAELPAMFSWLSNQIPEYPDTLNLKMYAHIQKPGWRPLFELELTSHPLSQEYHNGITPERVMEIMRNRLRAAV